MAIRFAAALALAWVLLPGRSAGLTIADVQASDAAHGWESPYLGQTVDVTGGIITYAAMPPGKPFGRVVIQDPTLAEWAGVEIKLFGSTPPSAFPLGHRVDLTSVVVDETYGTTYLLYDSRLVAEGGYGSGMTVFAGPQSVQPTAVSPLILGYDQPIAGPQDQEDANISADPAQAEKYEGMLLKVENVTLNVPGLGFGSHNDNYELIGSGGVCWAADYMNVDRQAGEDYHASAQTGLHYDAVVGVLEQYTNLFNGYDYYQLLTRGSGDFVPTPAAVVFLLAGGPVLLAKQRHRRPGRR